MPDFKINPQDVFLIPVDENDQVLLYSDLKIENVDSSYKTVRDANGVGWNLPPGDYKVRVFLRNLEMRTIDLKISAGVTVYKVSIAKDAKPDLLITAMPQRVAPPPAQTTTQNPAPSKTSRQAQKESVEEKPGEKRVRVPVSFPVSYRTNTGKWVNTKSLNLSNSGLCIENAGQVGQEDSLYVRLHVPVSSIPIECPARVVWVKIQDSERPRMGLQLYLTTNMQSSLENWISLMRNKA